ncbi:MAG: hypothetical protein ACLU7D_01055 [Collinsella sp.]
MVAKHRVNFFGSDGSGRKRQRVPVVITVDGHALDGICRTKRRPFVIRKKRLVIIASRGLGGTSDRALCGVLFPWAAIKNTAVSSGRGTRGASEAVGITQALD